MRTALLLFTIGNAVIQKCQSVVNLKWIILLLMGLTMNTLITSKAAAADHIQIVREVLLESERFAQPRAIVQTHEGGYVVAGEGGPPPSAWATRVNAHGEVQWRHLVSKGSQRRDVRDPQYSGAAMLPDDSAVLCGFKAIEDGKYSRTVGLLSHIGKPAEVISERLVYPNNDTTYELVYLRRCISISDGVLIFGTATRVLDDTTTPRQGKQFGWIVALDPQGNVKWEKLLEQPAGDVTSFAMSGPDVAIASYSRPPIGSVEAKQINVINSDGVIKAHKVIGGSVMLVQSVIPDPMVRFMPIGGSTNAYLTTLGPQLQDSDHIAGRAEILAAAQRAYYLPDRSIALFGKQQVEANATSASIAWLSADLALNDHLLLPVFASIQIEDAVPTGKPGEFATVRRVTPSKTRHGFKDGETRTGAILAFVQFK